MRFIVQKWDNLLDRYRYFDPDIHAKEEYEYKGADIIFIGTPFIPKEHEWGNILCIEELQGREWPSQIKGFVESSNAPIIIISCPGGQMRSPAIALALQKYYLGTDDDKQYYPIYDKNIYNQLYTELYNESK